MRKIIAILLTIPTIAIADDQSSYERLLDDLYGKPQAQAPLGLPVQPVLPVPNDRGPYGRGYSIVTTTRPTQNIFDRDITGSETVQRVVPNDYLGQPIKGFDLNNF